MRWPSCFPKHDVQFQVQGASVNFAIDSGPGVDLRVEGLIACSAAGQ